MKAIVSGDRYAVHNVERVLEQQSIVFHQNGTHDGTTVEELLEVAADKLRVDGVHAESVAKIEDALSIIRGMSAAEEAPAHGSEDTESGAE